MSARVVEVKGKAKLKGAYTRLAKQLVAYNEAIAGKLQAGLQGGGPSRRGAQGAQAVLALQADGVSR